MNRIATRALIMLVLVLLLAGGLVFFLGDYLANADDWILFPGSPHVYNGNKVSAGTIVDRDDVLLLDQTGNRIYSTEELLRRSSLHWVGDRPGNIRAVYVDHYATELMGFDSFNGVYTYGVASPQIQLTISAQLQNAALAAMGKRIGTVAVYNYKTGELLCAVTTPTFDPESPPDISGDDTGAYQGVYLNRFTQSKYIPGSIFKIVTLATALETVSGVQDITFECTGKYEIGAGDVTCEDNHGKQTLKEAFCNSCNCAFAQIVGMVGRETLHRYVELFGVTQPVTFDGITTVSGNFEVEGASDALVAWSGIGQHKDQVNPCAFLSFVGAIANDGVMVTPHVVDSVSAGSAQTYSAEAESRGRIMSSTTAKILQEYMGNNVQTKYGAENFPGLSVCAKSGTGEVGGEKKPNAMFTGFISDSNYPLAFIAVVEDGGYGTYISMPIVSQVLGACKNYLDNQ